MVAALLAAGSATAQMTMPHEQGAKACTELVLACSTTATPAFAPDGMLWLAFVAAGRVAVMRSPDLGRSFSTPIAVNAEPRDIDWGPDARPKIVVDRDGRVVVAFAYFRDRAFNADVVYTRSIDGGARFAPPLPITANRESQRFEALARDQDGALFAAWLDKRNRAPAKARNEDYVGAGLAFAWSNDHGTTFSDARIAKDITCECCRLGIAFAGPGRPVVLFRNVFDGTVRDHAITTFADPVTPGPVYRVRVDDWEIDACPHQGPSLAISAAGTYHAVWSTSGRIRQGLFYARSINGGASFSEPMRIGRPDRSPSRPYVLAVPGMLWIAWKEFDGEATTVNVMASHDDGRTWSPPTIVAGTSEASDHPLLVADQNRAFLSWQTKVDGYHLIPLEDRK